MNWKKIKKENSMQPSSGIYSDWKELIASECFHRCIYCSIHESSFGGIRNFHVEHYRPKSIFKDLINNIKNLYYACCICNCFKGNDWPNEPCDNFSNISYPDPSKVDYSNIFRVNINGMVDGLFVTSIYLVEKLYINRPQLIVLRRKELLTTKLLDILTYFQRMIPKLTYGNDAVKDKYLSRYSTIITDIFVLKEKLNGFRPYEQSDIRRKR